MNGMPIDACMGPGLGQRHNSRTDQQTCIVKFREAQLLGATVRQRDGCGNVHALRDQHAEPDFVIGYE